MSLEGSQLGHYRLARQIGNGGESATLYFSSGTSGSPQTQTVTLIQENGEWKIDTVTNS